MGEDHSVEIEIELNHVPKGLLLVEKHLPKQDESALLSNHFDTCSDGKGMMETFAVFPGIEISLNCFRANKFVFHHAPLKSVIQINHCRHGRIGWKMKDGLNIYLGSGDLSLHMMDVCAESEMNLPLGFYEGISIAVDLETLTEQTPEILKDAGIDGRQLYDKFCRQVKVTAMPASTKIDHIFSELYDLPEHICIPYFKLKVQELLLFLSVLDLSEEKELDRYYSQQVETIKEIHEQLTRSLDKRFTIVELSKQYLINTSSLKAIFKAVYGLPVASYMKEYRIKRAAELLRETNDSIAEIAAFVGYENQSKFTQAFKDVFQVLPTAYRKQYRQKAPALL
jgi:AraC-like DNA-binding protein